MGPTTERDCLVILHVQLTQSGNHRCCQMSRPLVDMTSSKSVNNMVLDVLEGQLTCLCILATFILIFLLREWVVNHQPNANIPEQGPENIALPAPQRERKTPKTPGRPRRTGR